MLFGATTSLIKNLELAAINALFASQSGALAQFNSNQNGYAKPIEIPASPPSFRTQEQIDAELDARMAELEAQAERDKCKNQAPCRSCRWVDKEEGAFCHNPLIVGFDEYPKDAWDTRGSVSNRLCGPEKVLWQERQSMRERFVAWFMRPFRDALL